MGQIFSWNIGGPQIVWPICFWRWRDKKIESRTVSTLGYRKLLILAIGCRWCHWFVTINLHHCWSVVWMRMCHGSPSGQQVSTTRFRPRAPWTHSIGSMYQTLLKMVRLKNRSFLVTVACHFWVVELMSTPQWKVSLTGSGSSACCPGLLSKKRIAKIFAATSSFYIPFTQSHVWAPLLDSYLVSKHMNFAKVLAILRPPVQGSCKVVWWFRSWWLRLPNANTLKRMHAMITRDEGINCPSMHALCAKSSKDLAAAARIVILVNLNPSAMRFPFCIQLAAGCWKESGQIN